MGKVATKSKGKKKAAESKGPQVWCQFEVSDKERELIVKARKARKFNSLGDYAKALISKDMKGLKLN